MYLAIPISGTGTVFTGAGQSMALGGASLRPAAAIATLTLRETDGSGRILAILAAPANGPCDHFQPQKPVQFAGVVHATLSGAGADAVVYIG